MSLEAGESSAPKLALFSFPPTKSGAEADHFAGMGMVTPPHHAASVPFIWEEQPGKPRPCKALSLPPNSPSRGLELPPRLLYGSKFTKTPSPTTVLDVDGRYLRRSIFQSFRLIGKREGSFDGGENSPERGLLGTIVLSKKGLVETREKDGFLGSFRRRAFSLKQGKREVADEGIEGSFVFSSFSGEGAGGGSDTGDVLTGARKRNPLGLTKARSSFWATIYEVIKQVIPGTRRRGNASKCKY